MLSDFLREQCVCGPKCVAVFAELREAYVAWVKRMSDNPMSSKAFGTALAERGFERAKQGNARAYKGLRLRTVDDDMADAKNPVDATQGGPDVDLDA